VRGKHDHGNEMLKGRGVIKFHNCQVHTVENKIVPKEKKYGLGKGRGCAGNNGLCASAFTPELV